MLSVDAFITLPLIGVEDEIKGASSNSPKWEESHINFENKR